MAASTRGIKYPVTTPTAIARKIHNVRYRSRNESFFRRASVSDMNAGLLSGFFQLPSYWRVLQDLLARYGRVITGLTNSTYPGRPGQGLAPEVRMWTMHSGSD